MHIFRHVEADGQPSKKSKKGGAKDQLLYTNGLCVSSFSSEKNLFYGKRENWDRITPSNSPRAHGTTQNIGKESVYREALFKSVNLKIVVLARPQSSM